MILWVYDRWGNQINCLGDLVEPAFDDELGALDYVEFELAGDVLEKGNYLVWRDEFGKWHEHIVRSVTRTHDDSLVKQSVYAVNSVSELNLSYIDERNSYGFSNSVAWSRLLEGTRWTPGTIDNLGVKDIKFYHSTVYEGLTNIVSKWGGEISTTIIVGTKGVTERRINHQRTRGEDNGLLFTYGFDAKNIVRKVELDDVYTRLHAFGKGEANYGEEGADPTYGRRITFADINGGKDYVEDNDAKNAWGVIGPDGSRQHSEGVYIFNDCEDPSELLTLARAKLEEVKQPRVTYSADVAMLADAGMEFKNAQTGDVCYIRDKELDERLNGRILHVKRYLAGTRPTEITLGNIRRTIRDVFESYKQALDSLTSSSANWDGMAQADDKWLSNMMDSLNAMMNSVGGYTYWEEGEGITVYDKPVDQNPTMCIQLSGAGFRIANSKKSNGEWDFHTFGTGDGFTADLINAGTIRGGQNYWNLNTGELLFKSGGIYDLAGKNYWNLDTGEFKLSATDTKVGSQTLDAYVSSKNTDTFASATAQTVFNKLTNNGQVQGITMTGGNLYINAAYISTGTIADKKGLNYWNLDTGEFKLSATDTKVGSQTLDAYISSKTPADSFSTATAQQVFNKLTNNGAVKGITMTNGNLYINADYIGSGTISGNSGNSTWNLNTGVFQNKTRQTIGGQQHDNYLKINGVTLEFVMDVTRVGLLYCGTSSTDPDYHNMVLMSYSDLILSSPMSLGVANAYPSSTSLGTWTAGRSKTITYLTDVQYSGNPRVTAQLNTGTTYRFALCDGSGNITQYLDWAIPTSVSVSVTVPGLSKSTQSIVFTKGLMSTS